MENQLDNEIKHDSLIKEKIWKPKYLPKMVVLDSL